MSWDDLVGLISVLTGILLVITAFPKNSEKK